MSFAESVTAREWIFTEESLRQHRLQANTTDGAIDPSNPDERAKRASLEEEAAALKYWVHYFLSVCKTISPDMPARIKATALSYFKRYFVNHSINNPENDPAPLLLASIFSACKTEEYRKVTYLHLKNLLNTETGKHYKVLEVKEKELRLLEGIKFHLNAYTPLDPARAILADFINFSNTKFSDEHTHKLRHEIEMVILNTLMYSDASLLFPPSYIAIAAVEVALNIFHRNQSPDSVGDSPLLASFAEYTTLLLQGAGPEAPQQLDSVRRYIVAVAPEQQKDGIKALKKVISYKKWLDAEHAKLVLMGAMPHTMNPPQPQPTPEGTGSDFNTV